MKKKIQVQHQHRYTLEKAILFAGEAEYNEYGAYEEYIYQEPDGTKVVLYVYDNYMEIQRFGEAHSSLTLKPSQTTQNPIKSVYGTFSVEVTTFHYQKLDGYVCVEYDVESGADEKDGFKIEVKIEEEKHEFH